MAASQPKDSLEIDSDLRQVHLNMPPGFGAVDLDHESRPEPLPPLPLKTLLVVLVFFALGSALIVVGTVSEMTDLEPSRGIAFWILGGLLFIPGSYYTFQFYKAYRATNAYERRQIIEGLPDLS